MVELSPAKDNGTVRSLGAAKLCMAGVIKNIVARRTWIFVGLTTCQAVPSVILDPKLFLSNRVRSCDTEAQSSEQHQGQRAHSRSSGTLGD